MRTNREDFFPSELYWLDRVGPVSVLTEQHGGVPTSVDGLLPERSSSAPGLYVMFDRLIEPDWEAALRGAMFGRAGDLVMLDARVTLRWPTSAGVATWKGHDAPYMILNIYELLMKLALAGAGRIRLYGYPHPQPVNRKFIPMPWHDVYAVAMLIERGGNSRVELDDPDDVFTALADFGKWP